MNLISKAIKLLNHPVVVEVIVLIPAQITSEVNNAGIFSVNVLGNFQIETVVLGSSRIE